MAESIGVIINPGYQMNVLLIAGIFKHELSPCGLLTEKYIVIREVDLRKMRG